MQKIKDQNGEESCERVLFLNGMIAEESWFDDEVTPKLFKDELDAGSGNITVWINSPGGDCVAAAQIYNMLVDYKGNVTVKIDGLAASAASVIAMAGDKVLMSPVSMLMIHNPATIAFGDKDEMKKAIQMLSEVKESIINAYEIKTGADRNKLMEDMEEYLGKDVEKIKEMGLDVKDPIYIFGRGKGTNYTFGAVAKVDDKAPPVAGIYYKAVVTNSLRERISAKCGIASSKEKSNTETKNKETNDVKGRPADEIRERLNFIKKFI